MKTKIYIYLTSALMLLLFVFPACESSDTKFEQTSPNGQGGSMARFTILNSHLYAVDKNDLRVFDITDRSNPELVNSMRVGFDIETIFALDNHLFIGSNWGMYIYNVTDPEWPEYVSEIWHINSCDPVVVNGDYAYVTLSSSSFCGNDVNELQIINVADLFNPKLTEVYPMQNPKGLGVVNDTLYLCDEGLKVYDVGDVHDIKLLQSFDIEAWDVIPYRGNLFVIGSGGFYQYSYLNNELTLLSQIEVQQQ